MRLVQERISGRRGIVALAWVVAIVSLAVFMLVRITTDRPAPDTATLTAAGAAPLSRQLYVDPGSQAATWVRSHRGTEARTIQERIADQPTAKWFGAWSGDIRPAVSQYVGAAAAQRKIPVLVAYNLPHRDCGGQSAGGLADAKAYAAWVDGLAAGIDNRRSLVILEPDALAQLDGCLSPAQQQDRLRMLSRAVDTLETRNVWVYLDAGHSSWVPAQDMAKRLAAANIAKAHGFSLNVSNFEPTRNEEAYAGQVNDALGMSKGVVIDTSRNGNGSADGQWCNPAGRMLGQSPRTVDGGRTLLLWVKAPGESDGDCGVATGTQAGQFVPKVADSLIHGR